MILVRDRGCFQRLGALASNVDPYAGGSGKVLESNGLA